MEHINGITKKYGIPEVHGTLEESLTPTTELNMNHYTSQISVSLAEKLIKKGMPITSVTFDGVIVDIRPSTYAEVLDWLMEQGIILYPAATYKHWFWRIETKKGELQTEEFESWHEAAEKAIEKALELI